MKIDINICITQKILKIYPSVGLTHLIKGHMLTFRNMVSLCTASMVKMIYFRVLRLTFYNSYTCKACCFGYLSTFLVLSKL